ncbi:outer membrane protein [Pseudoalteromonas citrea]|uniref:Outer membrane protein n=2 Tax=Pseudoalteromonas citrea TaxID=43655 RepID=A0AAD4AIL2_9GAMM|nr:MipA/OmpV family protein [Pseudoalteromonas citrea]KAF7771268.1 outer membrane protein [Pseudoalteromonas citrea]
MTFIKTTYAACLLACSTHTLAQQGPSELTWSLGIAAITSDQGYLDVGTETNLVPIIGLQYGDFSLLGPRASYKLFNNGQIELSAIGNLRFDGYEVADGDVFIGMEDRDMSFDAGIEAEIDTDFGEFGVALLHDITSTHKGFELSASYGIPFMFKNGRVMPYVSANYQSEDLADYYFGVKQNEATSSRAFYQLDATTNFEIGIGSDWMFNNKHIIKADISYSAYGSDIKDSPLIDKSGEAQILVGYAYVF